MLTRFDPPPLSDSEAAHAARVVAHVQAEIAAAGGWIPFARYMELVLYAPGLGYYAAGAHKLGRGGDFTTAPEISPAFARCVATQCADVLHALGGGDVLELGAGTGRFAVDALVELDARGELPARYRILEVSAELRERQRALVATLPARLAARVAWLDAVPEAPFRGVLFANEVLDALPVERFRRTRDGVEALGVVAAGAGFAVAARPADPALAAAVHAIESDLGAPLPDGFASEACVVLAPWLAAVSAPLAAGVALFVDYGHSRRDYYAPERDGGTLACHFRQLRHDDPFAHAGLQDLTAWVDFTAVASAGLACGLEVAGYTTQAHFLLGTGFDRHLAALAGAAGEAGVLLAHAAARLVLPGEMGERFKCLALSRGVDAPLAGFRLRDFAAAL